MYYIIKKLNSFRSQGIRRLKANIPVELHVMRKLKAYDIIQEHNQLTKVTKLPAEPFTLIGNI
jgi:hypothetical protein